MKNWYRGQSFPLIEGTGCKLDVNHRSYWAGRQYWACDNKEQCIKIQHLTDGVNHCKDRSDERKRPEDVLSPIQWDMINTCKTRGGNAGLTCSGQGLNDDCLYYYAVMPLCLSA